MLAHEIFTFGDCCGIFWLRKKVGEGKRTIKLAIARHLSDRKIWKSGGAYESSP